MKEQRTQAGHGLFIDASQHYEKVKTQNMLRPEDIDKIINTYRTYASGQLSEAAEDKYSYVATLMEIRENDFNLILPRDVDTWEEEEPVDIADVSAELKSLEKEMEKTDETIADYCNQLGIDTPF